MCPFMMKLLYYFCSQYKNESHYQGQKGREIRNNKVNQHFTFLTLCFSLWCFWHEKTQDEAGLSTVHYES